MDILFILIVISIILGIVFLFIYAIVQGILPYDVNSKRGNVVTAVITLLIMYSLYHILK